MNSSLVRWERMSFWDRPYPEVMQLQQELVEKVRNNPNQFYLLTGSHPHCFTVGRGLQKRAGGEVLQDLVDFDQTTMQALYPEWPIYLTSRAGGMTFHHPDQVVIYPIMNLNVCKISLAKIIFLLFEATKHTLERGFTLSGHTLEILKEPLGLWLQNKKIASVGMALDHFVSCHGLALNVKFDSKVKQMLAQSFPCGLPGETYGSLGDIAENKHSVILSELADQISEHFLELVQSAADR